MGYTTTSNPVFGARIVARSTTTESTTTTTETTTTTTTSTTPTTTTTTTTLPPEITTTYEAETTTLPLPQLILSGQYHEVNPGQYYEVNPGQYHEVNPGQYHEVNPGQYHEVNPGQYHEDQTGQYYDERPRSLNTGSSAKGLNDVKLDVKHTDEAQIYNVQSQVDKFIIGEYGTISKASGQTLQGVRYTAAADIAIDPNLIYETLIKYFPMQAGLDPGDYET